MVKVKRLMATADGIVTYPGNEKDPDHGRTLMWIFHDDKEAENLPKTQDEFAARWESQLEASHAGIWIPEEWIEVVHAALLVMYKVLPTFKISQIKEKFGGLRLYWGAEDLDPDKRIILRLIVDWAEGNVRDIEQRLGRDLFVRDIGTEEE